MNAHLDPSSFACGLAFGVTCGAWLRGTLDTLLASRRRRRRGSNPPPPGRKPAPPPGPEQPLTAQLIRYWSWQDNQVEQAFTESRVQRGNGSGGPSRPKPAIVPRPQGISSPRSADSSPRSAAATPINRCPGEGHWDGDEFHWMEGCDDCRRRTATEGPVTFRPPEIITLECPYRIEPDA